MADSRSKNASRNIVFAFANKIIAVLLPFVTRTITLYLLGEKYLGIGSLFTSVLSFLSLAELGLGSAIVYSMYQPIAENDEDKICALLAYYKSFYRRIGIAILAVGTLLVPVIPYLIKDEPPAGANVYILFYLYLLDSVISYFFAGYKQSLLTAHQRTDLISKITMVVNVLIQIGQIAVLVLTKNFYIYAIVPIVGTILTNILNHMVTNKRYPRLQCRGSIGTEDRQAIRKRLSGLVGTKLNTIVVHSSDMLVVSAFLGLTANTIYSNYYYIMNAVYAFEFLFFSSLTASVGNSIVTESQEKNFKLFQTISLINAWITGWCSVCLLCLYHPFMVLWVGERLSYSLGIEITLVVYFFVYTIQKTISVFKDAAGIWFEDRYRPYVCMTMNVILNVALVQWIGIYGVTGSSIAAFVISIPWMNSTLCKTLFQRSSIPNLLKIVYYAFVTMIAAVPTYFITDMLPMGERWVSGLGWLIVRFGVCLVIPNLVFMICYRLQPEFSLVVKLISSKFKSLRLRRREKI